MENRRFVSNILPELQDRCCNLQSIYENLPILPLETAVENLFHLVPDIAESVSVAKEKCNKDFNSITPDESAAIYLYTMPTKFFSGLNNALRNPNQQFLCPWLPVLKLLMSALEKLPDIKASLWRGVNYDATTDFVDGVYTWWGVTSCSKSVKIVQNFMNNSGTLFNIEAAHGKDISMFSMRLDEEEVILMPATRVRAKSEPAHFLDRLFIVHLEETFTQGANHIFEQIKQEYRRNGRIELFIDPAISFPLEQCYINLSIVETKEQHAKEKLLQHAQHSASVIGAYEEIYAVKTPVDVRDIFKRCNTHEKQVLVFGRAGIGKSTFCRHIAYQWAKGSYWTNYELIALIPLRQLTADRYPPGREYSLIDVVKRELFPLDLTPEEDKELIQQFDAKRTLWILDGYDEIVQTTPGHLQTLLTMLRKTPHHIITSRPYLNTLPYQIQMEIIGFTDKNIEDYVHNFFHQMQDKLEDAPLRNERLMRFLKSNASIWGVAHVPINLELICSLWSDQDWSETHQLTLTRLYSIMTEWLCRRYLKAQDVSIQQLCTTDVNKDCEEELGFLKTLAFHAMKSNTILLRPVLLKTAMETSKISRQKYSNSLNMGILKSLSKQGISTQVETNKDHYFLHLSFQEYFAARYFCDALQTHQTEESVKFIREQKYNQRYTLLFNFIAGLLSENGNESCLNLFWDVLLGSPMDLIGIRHMQLAITCMEEINDPSIFSRYSMLLEWIIQCLRCSFNEQNRVIRDHLLQSLKRSPRVASSEVLVNLLIGYLEGDNIERKQTVLSFIHQLNIKKPTNALLASVVSRLHEDNTTVRSQACVALGTLCAKGVMNEMISELVSALDDQSGEVKVSACFALRSLGDKAVMKEAISKLVNALDDQSEDVKGSACVTLGNLGEKAATNEVISKLVSALDDQSERIRRSACSALGNLGEKVATNEVISKLVSALDDQSERIRSSACSALGTLGEKAATNEVISKLVSVLDDQSKDVIWCACFALRSLGDKAVMKTVISRLVSALDDQSEEVKWTACIALGNLREKAATNEVISKLMSALDDMSERIRRSACFALGSLGEKAATNEVISKLVSALDDQSEEVKGSACFALGRLGGKAATNDILSKVLSLANNNKLDAINCVVILENSLSWLRMLGFDPHGLIQVLQKHDLYSCLEGVSELDVLSMLRETDDVGWLSLLIEVTVVKGSAVTAADDDLVLYDNQEPRRLSMGNRELLKKLIENFSNRAERLNLRYRMRSES